MTKTFTLKAILALTLATSLVQPADALPRTSSSERLTLRPVAVDLTELEPTSAAAQPAVAREDRSFRFLDAAALGLPTPAEQRPTAEALRADRHDPPAIAVEVERADATRKQEATPEGEAHG